MRAVLTVSCHFVVHVSAINEFPHCLLFVSKLLRYFSTRHYADEECEQGERLINLYEKPRKSTPVNSNLPVGCVINRHETCRLTSLFLESRI